MPERRIWYRIEITYKGFTYKGSSLKLTGAQRQELEGKLRSVIDNGERCLPLDCPGGVIFFPPGILSQSLVLLITLGSLK